MTIMYDVNPATDRLERFEGMQCSICGRPLGPDDEYYWIHEDTCPRVTNPDAASYCYCDLYAHAECHDAQEDEDHD